MIESSGDCAGGLRSNEQPGIGSCVGLVPTNALGSRNATGRISREQTSERIVAVWGKRPEFVARLPTQMVNDKGRYHDAADLKFSGRVFLYTEDLFSAEQVGKLEQRTKEQGLDVVFRTPTSALERSRYEKPLAFISHDWRDKKDIAQPIALGLSRMRCPVWYDEYSVKVGDSLRASVEKGLKESKKCVLILSSNFLSNTGWTKTEFDSIFTRQILEGSDVVLPVWCGVTKQQIYEYSPSLLDRLAVNWDLGIDEVLRKLHRAIEPPISNYTPIP